MKRFSLLLLILMLTTSSYAVKGWRTLATPDFAGPFTNSTYMDLDGQWSVPYIVFCDQASDLNTYYYYSNTWTAIGPEIPSLVIPHITIFQGVPYLLADNYTNMLMYKYDTGSLTWVSVSLPGTASSVSGPDIVSDANYLYWVDKASGPGAAVTAYKYNGFTWAPISSSFGNIGTAMTMAVHNGKPYIFFNDWSQSNYGTVAWFDGIMWTFLGGSGFTSVLPSISKRGICVTANGDVYVCYINGSSNAIVEKYTWLTSSWSTIGTFPWGLPYIRSDGNSVWLAHTDYSTYYTNVYKYTGSGTSWDTIGTNVMGEAIVPGYSGFYVYNDIPYFAARKLASGYVNVVAYTEIGTVTPTITQTATPTITATITPSATITPTPDEIWYRTSLTIHQGEVLMDSVTGSEVVDISSKWTWFKDGYSVFCNRDIIQNNTYVIVEKDPILPQFTIHIRDRSTLSNIDLSSNTCTVQYTVIKEP